MMEQHNWERDVRMRRWQRAQDGPTPYSEVRTWRRRFYAVLSLFLFALILLAGLIGGCRL